MPIEFTRKGRYEVWLNGQKISEHNQEREATETIINHSAVHGDGEYEIKGYLVMARAYGVVSNQDGGDTTPPTTPGSVSSVATSATTGTTSWTASTDNVGVAGYQIFVDGSPVGTTTNLSFDHTGLSPSTQYSVTVTAYDAAGNNSVAGGPALFTTDANSAPVWSLGNQAYETGQSVNIDLDSVCTDADGDTITYSLVSGSLPSGLSLSGSRNETLSGTVDTVESAVFTLGASDGIAAVQEVALTFTITAPDTTAPDAPTGLTVVSTTSSSVNLDWSDNAESDLNHYDVYRSTVSASGPWGQRNGSPLSSSNYSDTGLNELTQYWYYVTATDDSDNESDPSAVVTDTTDAASAAPYDLTLGGTRTPPFTVTWPTAPTITSEATVTPATFNANRVAGRRVTMSAGSYGDITLNANDQEFVIQSGVTVGTITVTGDRIKIRGETARVGTITGRLLVGDNVQDVLIDGVNQSTGINVSNNFRGVRFALINSSIRTYDFSTAVLANSAAAQPGPVIIANNDLESYGVNQAANRIQGPTSLIFVDNHAVKSGSDHNIFRLHAPVEGYDIANAWIENNQFEGERPQFATAPDSGTQNRGRIINVWWRNNTVYNNTAPNSSTVFVLGSDQISDDPEVFEVSGSTAYGNSYSRWVSSIDPAWSIEAGTFAVYETPPAWSFN